MKAKIFLPMWEIQKASDSLMCKPEVGIFTLETYSGDTCNLDKPTGPGR